MIKRFFINFSLSITFFSIIGVLYFYKGYNFLVLDNEIESSKLYVVATTNRQSSDFIINDLKSKNYEKIITTGPAINFGSIYYDESHYGLVTQNYLNKNGVNNVHSVKIENKERNIAYSLAKELEKVIPVNSSFNIYVKDIECKYYQEAFSKVLKDREIGFIPVNNGIFNSEDWYKRSMGIKHLGFAYIKYIYEIFT